VLFASLSFAQMDQKVFYLSGCAAGVEGRFIGFSFANECCALCRSQNKPASPIFLKRTQKPPKYLDPTNLTRFPLNKLFEAVFPYSLKSSHGNKVLYGSFFN
jgi:hypothetical protein